MDLTEQKLKETYFVLKARRYGKLLLPLGQWWFLGLLFFPATFLMHWFFVFFSPIISLPFAKYNKKFLLYKILSAAYSIICVAFAIMLSRFGQGGIALNRYTLVLLWTVFLVGIIDIIIIKKVLARKKLLEFDMLSNEVNLTVGSKAQKRFNKKAYSLLKQKDYQEFAALVNKVHADYEEKKPYIYQKNEFEVVERELIVAATVFECKEAGKYMRKRLKKLYEIRDYKMVRELHAEYSPRLEKYKANLLANATNGKASVVEYDGKGRFDGNIIVAFALNIVCLFVNMITLFIAAPLTICWKERYKAKHTVYKGKRLSFDGKAGELFGKYIVWILLTFITFGIYGLFVSIRLEKWKAQHTHVDCEISALGGTFDGKLIQKMGIDVLCAIINGFTLFICMPFTICIKEKWYCKHRVYDGKRLSFDGNGVQLMGKYIVWALLSVVTLGIYGLFITKKLADWKASHVNLSENIEVAL